MIAACHVRAAVVAIELACSLSCGFGVVSSCTSGSSCALVYGRLWFTSVVPCSD